MNWRAFFKEEEQKTYYQNLMYFLDQEYKTKIIYPKREHLFSCFELCPYEQVKVVILGQDPYHQPNQAHGLSFSVLPGVKIPPSLRNIYKELESDVHIKTPTHGYLVDWAKQGVLLMNTVMSVEDSKAGSHQKHGWEMFSDRVIQCLNQHETPIVFVLWGNFAKQKQAMINTSFHKVIVAPHPSPLSAYHGFFGSRPFSQINQFLQEQGLPIIDWALEEHPCLQK